MSQAFAARFQISSATDQGGGVWRVSGQVWDDGFSGYLATDVEVGDVFVDENVFFGTTNRWKITNIVSATLRALTCDAVWDDEGTIDPFGPALSGAALGRPSANYAIAEIPTEAFAKISENVKIKFMNINQRLNIDTISGGGDASEDFIYNVKDFSDTATIYHVAPDGNDSNSGLVRLEAFLTPQHAIDTASVGDVILLHEGTYEITAEITCNKGIQIIGVNGAANTIIQPTLGTQIRCMYIYETKEAVVRGITFRNGYTLLAGPGTNPGNGGGLCIWQDTGLTPDTLGSYAIDCVFDNCYAQQYGGGAHLMDHKSAVINCVFKNCTTATGGTQGGGGISLRWEGYARNCLVYDCQSAYGSGILCNYGVCQVHNCTIVDNTGHGITLYQGGSTGHQVYNCIAFYNSTANIGILGGATDIKNTTASPTPSGVNNIDTAPTFVDRPGDDYRLDDASVLRDYGMPLGWHSDFSDLAGQRIRYNAALGAYTADKSAFAYTNLPQAEAGGVFQYAANSTSGSEILVKATKTGITSTLSGGILSFSVPAGAEIISIRARVPAASLSGTSLTVDLGMNYTGFADRWVPNHYAFREDTGQFLGSVAGLSTSDADRFTISGLNDSTTNLIIINL